MSGKHWTKEDTILLETSWGKRSIPWLVSKLGRSENAIYHKVNRLKLGPFLENGRYITWNSFIKTISRGGSNSGDKTRTWITNRNFPVHMKKRGTISVMVVYIDEFWEWAKDNQQFIDFSLVEENVFGPEPDWVKEKRRIDIEHERRYRKYSHREWTKQDDGYLQMLLSQDRYTSFELSQKLRRTEIAVLQRIYKLGLERPVKQKQVPWTQEESDKLADLINDGHTYEYISEQLNRSAKSIRDRVYRTCKKEDLTLVRKLLNGKRWDEAIMDSEVAITLNKNKLQEE